MALGPTVVPLASLRVDEELLRLIPRPSAEDRQALKASLESEGQISPVVVTSDRTIIDGYTRRELLAELGVEEVKIHEVDLRDRADIIARVIALNVPRRHLSAWQRARIAVEQEPVFRERAAARQSA